jgi:hypothetical protein
VPSKSTVFVQEFVIGFGFLGGLFTWVGLDPQEEVIRALVRVAIPNNEASVSWVIVLFILVSTVIGVLGTLVMAGWQGLLIVGIAWVSGFIILRDALTLLGTIFFIIAVVLGPVVLDRHKD